MYPHPTHKNDNKIKQIKHNNKKNKLSILAHLQGTKMSFRLKYIKNWGNGGEVYITK
jgi:hypothetical protein